MIAIIGFIWFIPVVAGFAVAAFVASLGGCSSDGCSSSAANSGDPPDDDVDSDNIGDADVDAYNTPDAGVPLPEGGVDMFVRPRRDVALPPDATPPSDSVPPPDAGPPPDAAPPRDAVPPFDAAPSDTALFDTTPPADVVPPSDAAPSDVAPLPDTALFDTTPPADAVPPSDAAPSDAAPLPDTALFDTTPPADVVPPHDAAPSDAPPLPPSDAAPLSDVAPPPPPRDAALPPPDASPPPTPINLQAAVFPGPIADIDSRAGGGLMVYVGGNPATLWSCVVLPPPEVVPPLPEVAPLPDVECVLRANLGPLATLRSEPINYLSTGFGYGIAIAASPDAGTPIDIFRVNENADDPGRAVEGHDVLRSFRAVSGGGPTDYPIMFPAGLAAARTDGDHPEERFYIGSSYNYSRTPQPISFILRYSNRNSWRTTEIPIFNDQTDNTSVATTILSLDEGDTPALVALHAGIFNPGDEYTAGFSIYDSNSRDQLNPLKSFSIGEIAVARLPELALDATGRVASIVAQEPRKEFMAVNLESEAIVRISLDDELGGDATDLIVDGTRNYVADSRGRIIFIDRGLRIVMGAVVLPNTPRTLAVSDSLLFAGVGNDLAMIDPERVELE